jgi:hypothetical protein
MKIRQTDIILMAMLKNKDKIEWTAKDFQSGEYFVGYEATARMSELADKYPNIIKTGKQGRFRTLRLDWNNIDENFKKQVDRYTNVG